MKYMSHDDIRNTWFRYFKKHGHKIVESAPLIPINDDSLLWINAGVAPLKKYFDGSEVPESRRLTNIQKCIRTNDIENVGVTKRHQTFFEMMGNFSIGDYFKLDAIKFAYELLTSKDYFAIDKDLLYVTVYTEDEEAKNRWIELGMSPDHIIPLEENFWEIGEGPCGPDSEIFFDRGEKYDPEGDALEKFKKDEEQERYVEIWNNVFSQFNSKPGVARSEYKELPSKNIDTGAGLERWCCIFQDVDSNFETDLFTGIIKHIEELAGKSYTGQKEYKVIADHIRAITFALADGAAFENVGRGYVLRRLLRRSVRFGKQLGIELPFMYKLVYDVVNTMKEAYPYLVEKRAEVETIIIEEEKLFLKTLEAGEKRLKELVENSKDGYISGEEAFKLYDTYGFPFELTEEYLSELGYKVSKEEFDKYMKIQKQTSKDNAKTKSSMASQNETLLNYKNESQFCYGLYRMKSNIDAIFTKDGMVENSKRDCYIAIKRTIFYAEAGGQVSDTGMIIGKNFKGRVIDVFRAPNGQNIHKVRILDGTITVGDEVEQVLDKDRRKQIECNHSTVHMLQYALQQTIDKNIKQAGSYVDQDKLRFDFTYNGKMTDEKLLEVEQFVNDMINEEIIVSTEVMPLDKAKAMGAMALFGEKYGSIVRVVKIGKSMELCGGTHVANTKEIGKYALTLCESKGSNTYRIEGVTGDKISSSLLEIIDPYHKEIVKLLIKAKGILESAKEEGIKIEFDVDIDNKKPNSYSDLIFVKNELSYVQKEVNDLEDRYFKEKEKRALDNLDEYKNNLREYDGTKAIIMKVYNKDMNLLKSIIDKLSNEIGECFIFIANIREDKSVNFLAKSKTSVNAGMVVKTASQMSEGNGGGSPSFAQGGGKTTTNIEEVLNAVEESVRDAK